MTDREFRTFERDNLLAALEATRWQIYGKRGAASLLGMKPTTLSSRIRRLGLTRGCEGNPPPHSTPEPALRAARAS